MIRRACAIGIGVALLGGVSTAPLVHAHVGGSRGHQGASRIHTHLDGHGSAHRHASDGVTVDAADDADAGIVAAIQLFVAVHTDPPAPVALAATAFMLPAAGGSMARPLPDIVRSHGPPPVRALASRAPPVLPS